MTAQGSKSLGISSLSFIIPVRNDAAGVERCLRSIAACEPSRSEVDVLVVDNGSDDRSAEVAASLGARVFVAAGRVSALRNIGARSCTGRLLAFVDADHAIDPGWLTAAIEQFDADNIGAVGAPYSSPPAGTWVQSTYDRLRDHRPGVRDAAWLGSGNLVMRRECFEALRGFDETLETCEDVDLCQRLRAMGYRLLSDSRLKSVHFGDPGSLRQLFVSELWRGRDNLRVSLRVTPTFREWPGILTPIVDQICIATAVFAPWGGTRSAMALSLGAVTTIALVSGLRAIQMAARVRPVTVKTLLQCWSVALVYDIGRAVALVSRVGHRRSRIGPQRPLENSPLI